MSARSSDAFGGLVVIRKSAVGSSDLLSGRVAKRLVKLREEAGLSVEEVVASLNKTGYEIGDKAYRHWEANSRQVNWNAIPMICKALKVKPRDLIPVR